MAFIYTLFIRGRNHPLTLNDFVIAALFAVAFILLLPVISFITAKTQKRVLSIGPEGIETKIGTQEGKIPWQAVESITATHDKILITGKNANAFSIPTNAFAGAKQQQQFIDLASEYHNAVIQ